MAFRMGGLFIQAQVENGAGTFEIGSNNAFANALNSVAVTMTQGGASTIEVNLSPTFQQAVQIIESGFLGFGFPLKNKSNPSVEYNFTGGLFKKSINPISAQSSNAKASSLSVRFGYGDGGANPKQAITPWVGGIITAPDLSFGEEISVVMKAVSAGLKLTSADTTRIFNGETLVTAVEQIVEEDINGIVEFKPEAKARASQIRVFRNQTDNSMAFLKDLLSDYNFKFYESGGTSKLPKQKFEIDSIEGISNSTPQFTLVMYGQIDVSKKVYPIESFETNITHALVSGEFFGSKTTNTQTKNKEITRKEYGISTYKKGIKAKNDTVQGKHVVGKATKVGPTDGPPTDRDATMAGKRFVTVRKNSLDDAQNKAVESSTNSAIDGSVVLNVTAPLIPEAVPNALVRVNIFTGDPNNPLFKTVSGVYKIHEVRHSVSDSGGTTELSLLRGIGAGKIEQNGVQKVQDTITKSSNNVSASIKNLTKGIFK